VIWKTKTIFASKLRIMIRTIYTPNNNTIIFPIPEKYIGKTLEISVFPVAEISVKNKKTELPASEDASFGAWKDMDKSDLEICAEIKSSRSFGKREIVL